MVFRTLVVALIGTAITQMPMSPADVQAHRSRMIATQLLEQKVENALAARSRRTAAAGARDLVPILEKEQQYWDRTGVEDAMMFAERNLGTAKRLADVTKRGDLAKAGFELDALRANCVACHGRHPDTRVHVGR